MKLSALSLIVCLLVDSVAIADWPLHQNFPSVNNSQAKSFFDSHGRYIEPHMIYSPAIELHQANGTSRTLLYPMQLPDNHGHAQRHRGELHTASPETPPPSR